MAGRGWVLARSPLRVEDDVGDLWELRWASGGVVVPGAVSREKEDAGKRKQRRLPDIRRKRETYRYYIIFFFDISIGSD